MILIHIIFIKTMVSVWFDDVIHTISEGDSDLDGIPSRWDDDSDGVKI